MIIREYWRLKFCPTLHRNRYMSPGTIPGIDRMVGFWIVDALPRHPHEIRSFICCTNTIYDHLEAQYQIFILTSHILNSTVIGILPLQTDTHTKLAR